LTALSKVGATGLRSLARLQMILLLLLPIIAAIGDLSVVYESIVAEKYSRRKFFHH
jgi:hypothetical protein